MKNYRVSVLDFSGIKGRVISIDFKKGLKAARAAVPVKVHYNRNAGAFIGYNDRGREYWITEIKH